MLLEPNTLVQNRYRVVRLIGEGKMGAVYEAIDEHLSQTVALKQTLTSGDAFSKAFEREAKILAGLRHPVLPIVIDHFTNDEGQFMVMDYIPGKDLEQLLKQRGEPFLVSVVLKWADQVLHALEYMHRQNPPVVHRDIKPPNLKLTAEGQIVLLDFGLAKGKATMLGPRDYELPRAKRLLSLVASGDSEEQPLQDTSTDIFGFTRQYAPPEQVQGTGTDPRSDIYALAATLYHLLTGAPPIDALKRLVAMGYDNYSHYEAGLDKLKEQMQRHDLPYAQAATYDQQLRENIDLARLFGDNPTSQNERSDIIDQLEETARAELGISFHKLCRLSIPDTTDQNGLDDPLVPADEYNHQVPTAVSKVLEQALSLNPEHRPSNAETMRKSLLDASQALQQEGKDGANGEFSGSERFLPPHPEPSSSPLPQQWKSSSTILIVVIIAILITQVILTILNHQQRPPVQIMTIAHRDEVALSGTPLPTSLLPIHPASASQIEELALWEGHTDDVESVHFSPDGKMLVSGSDDQTIRLWRVEDGTLINQLTGHTARVQTVAFAPNGKLLVSGSADDTVRIWQISKGKLLHTLNGHSDNVTEVAVSQNSELIASGSEDTTIKLWRIQDGSLVTTLEGHEGEVNSVAFSPDGQLIVSGSEDNSVRIWRVQDATQERELLGHNDNVVHVEFSSDGQLVASCSSDTTIKIWQVRDGTLVHTLKGHTSTVNSITFSPDDELLVSVGSDDTMRLWRVHDGTLLHILRGHIAQVYDVELSSDGTLLATGSEDKTVRLWGLAE